ncbi:hypothetical protein VTJ04DRAFT_4471 [Mycothermus thermophilus]|uniref:uncharacterized protein n=1 Tax=Humicola insolens TaxID=85995 RepID=UPI0037444B64
MLFPRGRRVSKDAPPPHRFVDYKQDLLDLARLKIIVSSSLPKSKKSKKKWARAYRYPGAQGLSLEAELELTCRTVTRLFHNAAPPKPSIRKYSECFEDELLRQGRLFTAPEELRKTCQLSAQLHCLLGWDLGFEDKGPEDVFGHSFKNDDIKGYLASRMWRLASKMYDLREYGVKYTLYPRKPYRYWSPFTDDGGTLRVDWETLETIMFVLGSNIRYKKLANFPFFGLTLYGPFTGCWKDSYIPWTHTVCPFHHVIVVHELTDNASTASSSDPDYGDFTWTNGPAVGDPEYRSIALPAQAAFLNEDARDPLELKTETHVMALRLRVTRVETQNCESEIAGGDDLRDRDPAYPVTYFTGLGHRLHTGWLDDGEGADLGAGDGIGFLEDPNSAPPGKLRGHVYMTRSGYVRWCTRTWFWNEPERWGTDGVQFGGIRSARGVWGMWFNVRASKAELCGPAAYWKISNRVPAPDETKLLWKDIIPFFERAASEIQIQDPDSEVENNVLTPYIWANAQRDVLRGVVYPYLQFYRDEGVQD